VPNPAPSCPLLEQKQDVIVHANPQQQRPKYRFQVIGWFVGYFDFPA
jgi:hypothetical protein